jgi:MFS family permease
MGFIPVTGLLFKWFHKRRGMAIGVSGVGIGVGSFVMAPLLGGYVIPYFGWRAAFLILGVVPIIVFIPLVLLVVKESPEVMGLQPDGIKKIPAANVSVSNTGYRSGLSLRQALKTSAFWLMAIPGATFSFATMGIIQNQVVHLTDIGFSAVIAAGVVGIIGITNSAGKFSFGLACDRIRPKYARVIVVSLMVIGILMFMNLKSTSPMLMVWLYTFIMGFGLGGWMPTMSLLVSSSFGMVAFGTIFGIVTMFNMLGSSIGPLFAGYIFDVRGSYYVAFVTFLILYILTLAATLLIRQPKFT